MPRRQQVAAPEYASPALPRRTPNREITKDTYRVVVTGPRAVYGLESGVVGELELTEGQYRSLVRSNHIQDAPVNSGVEETPEDNGSPADGVKEGE